MHPDDRFAKIAIAYLFLYMHVSSTSIFCLFDYLSAAVADTASSLTSFTIDADDYKFEHCK